MGGRKFCTVSCCLMSFMFPGRFTLSYCYGRKILRKSTMWAVPELPGVNPKNPSYPWKVGPSRKHHLRINSRFQFRTPITVCTDRWFVHGSPLLCQLLFTFKTFQGFRRPGLRPCRGCDEAAHAVESCPLHRQMVPLTKSGK